MLVNIMMGAILLAAMIRRPGIVTSALVASFLLGVLLSDIRQHDALRPLLVADDAFVILAMRWAQDWRQEHLARTVATLSMLSIATAFAAIGAGWSWNSYAGAINGIALTQAIFSGGFGDGFLAWVAHRFGGDTPERDDAFRYVEGV